MDGSQVKIATLNINGITARTRIGVLEEFMRRQNIDILLVQEVTAEVFSQPGIYRAYYNIGSSGRGTAILVKEFMELKRIIRLPSGRGLAAEWNGTWLVNVYAPSGAELRREREEFFATEVPILLQHLPERLIVGGDFNCVLSQEDCTGKPTYSGALKELVRGYDLLDVWNAGPTRGVYTHYSRSGATRIDRIYVTQNIYDNKDGVEVLTPAMSDHLAVILRVKWDRPRIDRGKGSWRMDISLLNDKVNRNQLRDRWMRWKANRRWYPDTVAWWTKSVKHQLRKYWLHVCAEAKREDREMENFLYSCLYDILQTPQARAGNIGAMNRITAKIVDLHRKRMEGIKRGGEGSEVWLEEKASIYNIIRQKQRREQRTVTSICDDDGRTYTDSKTILAVFREELQRKYANRPVEEDAIREILSIDHGSLDEQERDAMDEPLTEMELRQAINKGGGNKAPGPDGIGRALFLGMWEDLKQEWMEIFKDMFDNGRIEQPQTMGIVICIPKKKEPVQPSDYRNITLLNTDYKILARIIAARLQPMLGGMLNEHQYCGATGRTMFDAVSTLRDVIAQAEMSGMSICVLSLDFAEAFDRISHQYLFAALRDYGCSPTLIGKIRMLYQNATSQVQINGFRSASFPIASSIRQGCPLSMLLFAICIDPLLWQLEKHLAGVKYNRGKEKVSVVAYADDVSIILTDLKEIRVVKDILHTFERASGAKLNVTKSAALACGTWNATKEVMGIGYKQSIRILGFQFTKETNKSQRLNWEQVEKKIKLHAQGTYHRELGLAHRIKYAQVYLLAKLWHIAHIFPPWEGSMQRIMSAIAWYIWKGEIFRVPLSTLQKNKSEGGWNMINVEAKCRTIFYVRMWAQLANGRKGTTHWLRSLQLDRGRENPPREPTVSHRASYLYCFMLDRPYIEQPRPGECPSTARRRIYQTMKALCRGGTTVREMRIVRQVPNANWNQIWNNLHDAGVGEVMTAQWYRVVHDLLPTRNRLQKIQLAESTACTDCGGIDTRLHRIVECGEREAIWQWTQQRLAWILRTIPARIPVAWVLTPDFVIWPPKRRRVVAWMLNHLVWFCTQTKRRLTIEDYSDFLRRARRKEEEECKDSDRKLARYLIVLD